VPVVGDNLFIAQIHFSNIKIQPVNDYLMPFNKILVYIAINCL
jgi:hypothetical protein